MPPNSEARKNHAALFPGHAATLAVTDPELIETFDNFALDEVLRHGSLDTRTRLMVQLAAIIACQALRKYRVMLGAAFNVGVTRIEAKEIVYQAVPYVGMAKAYDFIHATNEVHREFRPKLLNSFGYWAPEIAARVGFGKIPCSFPCWQGIGQWRQVRLRLRPPPGILVYAEISRLRPKGPHFAAP